MKQDLVSVVEAAYRLDVSDEQWLRQVAESVAPVLDAGLGVLGWFYDCTEEGCCRVFGFVGIGAERELLAEASGGRARPGHGLAIPFAFASRVFGPARWRELGRHDTHVRLDIAGQNVHLLNAVDPTGHGCIVSAAEVPGKRRRPAYGDSVWARIAAHVAAGLRIRRRLGDAPPATGAEAVVEPNGRVAHAVGLAKTPQALIALRRAALASDKARGKLRRTDPERAIGVWHGLVEGRWTLVDQFERDGRRYLVAHRNDPLVHSPRALTLRERQVLAYAVLGHSTKLIAYELGLSVGATSAYLAGAMRKLGLRSRMQLASLGSKLAVGTALRRQT